MILDEVYGPSLLLPKSGTSNYAKAKIETFKSDRIVAPLEVFIANTHPQSTEDIVKNILTECADADKSRTNKLDILEVKCMTNLERFPHQRTLYWKVVVPHREREYMLKDESYPTGRAHRRFFPPRQSVPLLIPPAKHSRTDGGV